MFALLTTTVAPATCAKAGGMLAISAPVGKCLRQINLAPCATYLAYRAERE